jgi:biotin-(acetyl-CoA carboxylase) ligase
MGKRVTLILGDERIPATVLSVDDEGRLLVDISGEARTFSSAEVSIWL